MLRVKCFIFFVTKFSAHVIPGLLLLSIPFVKEPGVVVAILTISLGFNGAAVLTNLQNTQDLAPNYAGTLYSIINTIGFTSGALGPIIKNELTKLSLTVSFHRHSVHSVFKVIKSISFAFVLHILAQFQSMDCDVYNWWSWIYRSIHFILDIWNS